MEIVCDGLYGNRLYTLVVVRGRVDKPGLTSHSTVFIDQVSAADGTLRVAIVKAGLPTCSVFLGGEFDGRATPYKIGEFDGYDVLSAANAPGALKTIGEEAFAGAAFNIVYIASGAESVGARAFADCEALYAVHIPSSVTEIAPDAFEGCDKIAIVSHEGDAAYEYARRLGISWLEEK